MRRDTQDYLWLGPGLWALSFVFIFAALLGLLRFNFTRDRASVLQGDIQGASDSFKLRLTGTQDYLTLLANARARGALSPSDFRTRAMGYVALHRELLNITWVGPDLIVRDVAPREGNEQILGLSLDLPEPRNAASQALQTRLPAYTRPFQAIQGNPSFELWVPVFRGDRFLGLFAAVYSIPALLEHVTPESLRQQYQVALTGPSGNPISTLPSEGPLSSSEVQRKRLVPPDNGLAIRLIHHETRYWTPEVLFLSLFCVASIMGMAYGMWALKRDLTRRKKSEQERDSLVKKLQDAVRARDEFLVIASHELKTPLTSLVLQIQMLSRWVGSDRIRGEEAPKAIQGANKQVRKLATLVENLLDVSRISTGRLKLEKQPVRLGSLVDSVLAQLGESLRTTENTWSVKADPSLEGEWDPIRIEQVLNNLLTNAMKYAPGTLIEIEARREDQAAVIRVRDHGPGIPEESRERIFGAFERAISHVSVSGFGMGLFICRQIVEAHGGDIGVESKLGEGATFRVRLPLTR
ncbi:MAG: ATP-binding protein [Oligoflexia bacterium]|nr:ATP-binding protein [Oligoflexia bacterium]